MPLVMPMTSTSWPSWKAVDGDDVADLEGGDVGEADLGEDAGGVVEAGLLGVVELGLARVLGLLGREADLDGVVAVGLDGLHLHDGAGAGFDHGDRDQDVLGVVDLGHADFFAE